MHFASLSNLSTISFNSGMILTLSKKMNIFPTDNTPQLFDKNERRQDLGAALKFPLISVVFIKDIDWLIKLSRLWTPKSYMFYAKHQLGFKL